MLFVAAAFTQYAYDGRVEEFAQTGVTPSPALVRSLDLGLHSALASFLWIQTRTELPFLQFGYSRFAADLGLINTLDPKFSTPYAYTVLVMPNTNYPDRLNATYEAGKRGVRDAEPNWQIPFYLAAAYHLYGNDKTNAALYFDTAARTPGIPETVRRFSINYGVYPTIREQTKQIWKAIYENSKDKFTKERAKAYVVHFEIFDYLEGAVKEYKTKYGKNPATLGDLVKSGVVPEIPRDPFELEFDINGGAVIIKRAPPQ